MLAATVPASARTFGRVLVMPNTVPPVTTADDVRRYAAEITAAAPAPAPLFTIRIGADVAPDSIADLARAGVLAGKLYPQNATTNSADGVTDPRQVYPLLEAMQDAKMVLCIHAEDPSAPVLEREAAYLPVVGQLARAFPRLRIVIEHISTKAAVEALSEFPETVGATVTAHHLCYTIDDLLGSRLNPHLFCKPVVKTATDRAAIQDVVAAGNPRIFFGSDSAPHPRDDKESAVCAAGVFTAPVAMELLVDHFLSAGLPLRAAPSAPASLEQFCAGFGADFYRLPPNRGTLEITDEPYHVPAQLGTAVPWLAGTELRYTCRRPPVA